MYHGAVCITYSVHLTHLFSQAYNELGDLPNVDDVLGILLTSVNDLRAPRHLCADRQADSRQQAAAVSRAYDTIRYDVGKQVQSTIQQRINFETGNHVGRRSAIVANIGNS